MYSISFQEDSYYQEKGWPRKELKRLVTKSC